MSDERPPPDPDGRPDAGAAIMEQLSGLIDGFVTGSDADRILSSEALVLRESALVQALADELSHVDAGLLRLVGWLCWFRYEALSRAGDAAGADQEFGDSVRLFLVLDLVRPDLVTPGHRANLEMLRSNGALPDLAYRERELAEVLLGPASADLPALDAAIGLIRKSIEHSPAASIVEWNALMRALWRRYRVSARVADLTEVIDVTERALSLAAPADRATVLSQIGFAEQFRYDRTGSPASLARCVEVLAEALELTPPHSPSRVGLLVGLGMALRDRGQRVRSVDDVERAIQLTREALAEPGIALGEQASALSMLGLALRERFELTGRAEDLDDALAAARASVAADTDADRSIRIGNLGLVLSTRHHHRRNTEDLAELVRVARLAVETARDQHQRGLAQGQLSVALSRQADASGRLADLNGAINAARVAVGVQAEHQQRTFYQHNLAGSLHERFLRTGSAEDLDEAIEVSRAAVAATDADDPRRAMRLSGLAGPLASRYGLTDQFADLLDAVVAAEESVLCSRDASPEYAGLLSNLSGARRMLAEHTGQVADADAAVRAAARALASDTLSPGRRYVHMMNLAACYGIRFRAAGGRSDLDRAIDLLREALAEPSAVESDRCALLSDLGQRQIERYETAPGDLGPAEIAHGVAACREAARMAAAPATTRLRAAGRWGVAAERHGLADAADGYAAAVGLLPLAAWHGLDRPSQERQLTTWGSLVTTAAAWALETDHPRRAIELLEQGRGVLWTHQLGRRTDLAALHVVRPDLADRLEAVRIELDAPRDNLVTGTDRPH